MGKSFFDEIVDVPKFERFVVYGIGTTISLIMLWVYVTIPMYEKSAMIYLIMLIIWVFGLSFDLLWHSVGHPNQAAVNGVGKKPWNGLLWGLLVGILLSLTTIIGFISFSVVDVSMLGFLFIVVAAPFVEANFFRGVVQSTFTLLFNDWFFKNKTLAGVISMIITSIAFAAFHVNIVGGVGNPFNIMVYFPYFLFGMISTLGVYGVRSIGFEYGLHGVNNLMAFLSGLL